MSTDIDITKEYSTVDNEVVGDNQLKDYIINYVGEKKDPENEQVTVGMIVDVLAEDFPELVLCLSEENWIRGYQQALTDVQEGERLHNERLSKEQSE